MHRVRNAIVWQAKEAIQEIIKAPWPVKTAYGLAKLGRRILEQHAILDQTRTALIMKYGHENGKGQHTITPGDENWPQFVSEMNELMEMETTIECATVVLPDSDIELPPAVLMGLEPFLDMPDAVLLQRIGEVQ